MNPPGIAMLLLPEGHVMTRWLLLLPLGLGLAGCTGSPALPGTGPGLNRPTTDSMTMRRVAGEDEPFEPLRSEAGNIWPGADQAARRGGGA